MESMIKAADRAVLVDMRDFPSWKASVKDVPLLKLLAEKAGTKGVDVFVVAHPSLRDFSISCPGVFAQLVLSGAKVIFSDPDIQRNTRSFYTPGASFLADILRKKPVRESDGKTFSRRLDEQNGKYSSRNLIITESAGGVFRALTGAFSYPPDNRNLELAVSFRGDAVIPAFRSELELAREYLAARGHAYSKSGEAAILRAIELKLKSLPDAGNPIRDGVFVEFLTEVAVADKISWLISGITSGDSVDIIAGAMEPGFITDSLRKANLKNRKIRIIFDKNSFSEIPGLPNAVSAEKLFSANKSSGRAMDVRWFDEMRTTACLIHVYNLSSGINKVLVCSSPWTGNFLKGANLSSALYIQGKFNSSKELAALFENFWLGAGGEIYTVEYKKLKPSFPRSVLNNFLLMIKKYSGWGYDIENNGL
jgi:hypothetical protein